MGLRFCAGVSLVAASGGHSSSRCAGLSPSRPLLLRSTGSRRSGSAAVAHGPSRSAACGILPDQGSNPRPLHQQADSQPLRHQGSPRAPSLSDSHAPWTCDGESCLSPRAVPTKHSSFLSFTNPTSSQSCDVALSQDGCFLYL